MKDKTISLINLGFIDYKEAWDLQESFFSKILELKRRGETRNYILICEHPHVYTIGSSCKDYDTYLLKLSELGLPLYKINRGGDITYHGPGQLVVYPILDLDNFFNDVHLYLRKLEEIVISTLGHFNIFSKVIPGYTGVWILSGFNEENDKKNRKICSIGVRVSRWVTMHGLALNVNNDLSYFNNIIPCGIEGVITTSMANELNTMVDIDNVKNILISKFKDAMGCAIINE